MKKDKKSKIILTASLIISVLSIFAVLYIMVNHLGLIDSLDFGAGAYYYADMPGFEKLVNTDAYTSGTPMWAIVLLFLIWGFLMYRLWIGLDKKFKNE